MEWYAVILLFFILLLVFIFFGFPIAFAFLTINIILTSIFIGFTTGMSNLVSSSFDALTKFSLTPIPLFILMGEILFHSGLVMRVLDGIAKFLGKVPSRLSVLTLGTGTLLSAMSGSAVADAAMLGSTLAPEMRSRGYHLKMIVGPILAAGSLALIMPPSTTAILLGSTARISVGDLLIAGIVPALLIAITTMTYFMVVGYLNPSLAPHDEVSVTSWSEKARSFFLDILPVCALIIVVLGFIFLGIVTPTESAATGALGAIILALLYRKLDKAVLKKALLGTLQVSCMILLILGTSAGFSQLLAYTGATRELVDLVLVWDIAPIITIILMLMIVFILGAFIDPISIMMITIPLFIPVVTALDYDLVWFGILMLISLGLGNITPPFGLLLFVIKGVLPNSVGVKEVYKSVTSIVIIQVIVIILIIMFPTIVTWLPYLGKET